MQELPNVCKDCAEYGSVFCDECIEELTKKFPEIKRFVFSKVLREIAKKDFDRLNK